MAEIRSQIATLSRPVEPRRPTPIPISQPTPRKVVPNWLPEGYEASVSTIGITGFDVGPAPSTPTPRTHTGLSYIGEDPAKWSKPREPPPSSLSSEEERELLQKSRIRQQQTNDYTPIHSPVVASMGFANTITIPGKSFLNPVSRSKPAAKVPENTTTGPSWLNPMPPLRSHQPLPQQPPPQPPKIGDEIEEEESMIEGEEEEIAEEAEIVEMTDTVVDKEEEDHHIDETKKGLNPLHQPSGPEKERMSSSLLTP
ncbi:hypothetical protein BDN72DRAFT_907424 [Pluteus cervinus]|uniref:Uncharacterized protein n=1 Tax=Pluteus cervinus TaxID=181527 RepID=A0ACD2ZWU7_9AGAR|nr:hypothetical protein BDN72DRAFT_907424 [Pluteus cervinus]